MKRREFRRVFGYYMRQARENRDFTVDHLAHEANVDRRTIQRIESGETSPKHETVFNLAYALQIDINEIHHQIIRDSKHSPPLE
ncbi:hypothetical protein GCM10008986_13310 [Salinibacillus aidingensis]|uniref:HTH cro/C1-type domain-containing protein n=1 Tax=Salinibacillus aidingensis TaxID=237684 RepID=A0ABP3L1K9_9BACI